MLQNREDVMNYMNCIASTNFCEVESERFSSIINELYDLSMSVVVRSDAELYYMVKNLLESTIEKIKEEANNRINAMANIAAMM